MSVPVLTAENAETAEKRTTAGSRRWVRRSAALTPALSQGKRERIGVESALK
jgi:hypothetical protein